LPERVRKLGKINHAFAQGDILRSPLILGLGPNEILDREGIDQVGQQAKVHRPSGSRFRHRMANIVLSAHPLRVKVANQVIEIPQSSADVLFASVVLMRGGYTEWSLCKG